MAQAFSSFDTYLAPFVKKDNLSYKQVKQCIQSFIFGVNTPSRWGCEKITTQVMTPNGFKNYSDLKVGDIIYTWVNGTLHEAPIKNLVYRKNNYGVLHQYKGTSYRQTVTPEHRCIIETNDGKYFVAEQSMNIFNKRKDVRFPTGIVDADCDNVSCLNDNEVVLAAMYYADDNGWTDNSRVPDKIANAREKEYMKSLVGNKNKINDVFLHMNKHQSQLFLKTWASFGGDEEKLMCRYDKNGTKDALHLIMLRAGYISYVCSTKRGADETPANYVAADFRKTVVASEQNEIPYDGYVWCPNTNDGTAIYRDEDGYIFISGNCQSPFTNITLDWVVPPDMADMPCLIGGKEMDFTYSDCKKEMDMVNKAFIETMLEGDSNGRGFQYPIPTYSITKDFDWSETENNKLLFEMTAKYGTPYFSNYINSDMEPSDVRSMAILGTQNVIYKDINGRVSKNEIRHLVNQWLDAPNDQKPCYELLMNGKFVKVTEMFKIDYSKYNTVVEIKLGNGVIQKFSYDHKCPIVRNGEYKEMRSQDLMPGDKFLLAKHSFDGLVGNYQSGKIIGYYLAEGWVAHNDAEIDFAINDERLDIANEIIDYFNSIGSRAYIDKSYLDKHIYKVKVFGHGASGFVTDYITGKSAKEKRISVRVFDTSADFRRGIYDGYLETDGSKKSNIYAHTTNKNLCKDLIELAASIGKYLVYSENNNNTRYFKADKSDFEHFSSYKLREFVPESYNDDYYTVDITEVSQVPSKSSFVYNFTVDTKEHLYELPNGIITHQCCRLRLDLRELRRKSGGFFGSGESTGCYDDQTEILTDNRGWIYFKDLTMDDVVLTRNSQGIIEKYHPTQLFKYPYNGKLYHFKNSRFDMMVTPNHKMVYCDKHTNAQKFVRADEYSFAKHPIPRTAQYSVPDIEYFELPKIEHEWNSGNHNSNMTKMWPPVNVKMDDWLRFLGWYLSKGSCDNENIAPSHGYRVVISEFKPDNVLSIEKLLSRLPFNYTKTENEFVICNKQLWNYCKQFGNYYNKFIPREILSNCSLRQLNILLDTMIAGNGSINTNSGQKTYYTSSRRLANDFQELCLKCGFSTNIKKRQPRNCCIYGRTYTKEQCSICYEMTITQNKSYYIMKENVNQVDYKGFVYCCEVPNHTLMVRRNGKATWCGNSVGVVTINMPQIAYLSKNEDEFFARLDRLMDISARSLDVKRRTITKLMEEGLYPYTKRYLGSFNNHFSTIGLIGMNEVGLNAAWLKKDMTHPETQEFSKKVLNHMRKRLADYQEKYGDLFNLEATPAESTTYRFAKHDVETYPDIITAAPKGEDVFYTNSSHLPVGFTSDIFDALDIQDELQTLYTSGTVFHAFLGEKLPDWKAAASLVKKIAENYKLPYYTMSPIYSICKNHGYLLGEQTKCPHCGGITEIYSRITGYYRPVQNWNVGKTQEYKERKLYDIGNSCLKKDNSTTFTEIKDQTKKISREETDARIIDEPQTEENKDSDAKILLYATGTCPKCRIAMKLLNDAHVEYKKILVEENLEEARRLGLKQAPSLVINGNVYAGLEEIKKAIQNLSK